jgi:hypothetical protein
MPYKMIQSKQLDSENFTSITLLSDGKDFHRVSNSLAQKEKQVLQDELAKLGINPRDKVIFIINPILFTSERYKNVSIESIVKLSKGSFENDDSEFVIQIEKRKIRYPYPNKSYVQNAMKKGNKICKFGQVFVFDSMEELEDKVKQIEFIWSVHLDDKTGGKQFIYGAKTIVRPLFISSSQKEGIFYLKNIDAWLDTPESKRRNSGQFQNGEFPFYQSKEVHFPNYDSAQIVEQKASSEAYLEQFNDAEEYAVQKIELNLYADDAFYGLYLNI